MSSKRRKFAYSVLCKNLKLSLFLLSLAIFFISCDSKKEKRIVIWTGNSDFAPYIELFNETHEQKAILEYKETPSTAFPVKQNERKPDLVIGSWLRNDKTKHYFHSLNFIFNKKMLEQQAFYPSLFKSGEFSKRQYLLPVSFNLPAIIFSSENKDLIADNYTISFDEIKKAGTSFNKKNKNGAYTRMGFAPQSSDDFLYLATKLRGAAFYESKNGNFSWNSSALAETISYLNNWICSSNGSIQTESDFVYKYLSEADYKRVTSGRTLFAYTTSNTLLKFPESQLEKIDYRWIQVDGLLPVEDSMMMVGIARGAKNKQGAVEFISWFFNTQTQKALLDRTEAMNLNSTKFGIAGGFSSIKEVNDYILPSHYEKLLSFGKEAEDFMVFERKPPQWEKIKQAVIIPYIKEAISSENNKKIPSIEERYSDWKKQVIMP